MNKISIRFSNGDLFHVPAHIIAKNRTEYYAEKADIEEGSPEWEEEYKHSLNDYEVLDWVQNNMDWEELEPHAIRVYEDRPLDYSKAFYNSEINYIKNGN